MGLLKNLEPKKRQLPPSEAQSLLKEEILQLQKELEGQTVVRCALEKAMNCQPLLEDPVYKSLSQPAENLIKEIALLEMEVVYLEKYLLSMYRKTFAKRLSTLPNVNERQKPNTETSDRTSSEFAKNNLESVNEDLVAFVPRQDSTNALPKKCNDIYGADSLVDSGIYRSHSSLSHRSACSFRYSPPFEGFAEAIDSYHSLPLSMLERTYDAASSANLADYIGSNYPDDAWDNPNRLSEDMIKCISTIYCNLSDPPIYNPYLNSVSPGKLSPRECEGNSSFSSWLNNPFNPDESFVTMVEIQGIFRNSEKLNSVKDLLDNYRFLISRLAQVDPGTLKHEEKLTFWINVHNSLVMHAYLVYGIPRGSLKRVSSALKAAYNIGGHTISVETIQSSILGCRLPRPTQWLQSLFFPKAKFKSGDARKTYAIKYPEPRLRFALCSGCLSDAAVCVYTPKKVFQELEMAKENYLKMNIRLHKEQRLLIPKNMEYFVKEAGLFTRGIEEMVEHSMPDSLRTKIQQGKSWKKIDFVPHNFTFRFLLSNELVRLYLARNDAYEFE